MGNKLIAEDKAATHKERTKLAAELEALRTAHKGELMPLRKSEAEAVKEAKAAREVYDRLERKRIDAVCVRRRCVFSFDARESRLLNQLRDSADPAIGRFVRKVDAYPNTIRLEHEDDESKATFSVTGWKQASRCTNWHAIQRVRSVCRDVGETAAALVYEPVHNVSARLGQLWQDVKAEDPNKLEPVP